MQLHVLGSVRLYFDDKPVDLGSGRERELLTYLALAGRTPLPAAELANRLWASPPSTYRSTLHTYVTRLRRRLETAGIERTLLSHEDSGYRLGLEPEDIDWSRLERLREHAHALRRVDQHATARTLLREALRLRKDTPLAGLSGQWAARMRHTMEQVYQDVLSEWAELALASGETSEVLDVLDKALMLYPTNEVLHRLVLRTLRSVGRSADALVVYQRLKNRLAEDLGVDPSRETRREFEEILQTTKSNSGPRRPEEERGPTTVHTLDNLDREQKLFRGREPELLLLTSRLRDRPSSSPRVWAISGMAGVGKSSLAMRAAHQVKSDFPHARLTLDLRGSHGRLAPLTPTEAMTELLRLLRIPATHIPESLPEQVALWRAHTRSMRLLLVLDDAASSAQVAPLLPVGAESAVLITSRFQLTEINEVDHLPLGLPSPDESTEIFIAASGRPQRQMEADPLLEEVITRCGRLPLAMRLVATILRLSSPSWSLRSLLDRLSVGRGGLDAFRSGETDLARVFDLALRSVSDEARRAFLYLGLHPTRIMSGPIAAALISSDESAARDALAELVSACLIEEHRPDRFRLHTLLKDHASDIAARELPSDGISASRGRMYEVYLNRSLAADRALHPHRPGRDEVELEHQVPRWDRARAEAWFRGELPNLVTLIGVAQVSDHGAVMADLAHAIAEYLDVHGPWHIAPSLHERACREHRESDPARRSARGHFDLARALLRTGDFKRALHCNRIAREQWRKAGDGLGEAWAIAHRGQIRWRQGRYDLSLELLEQALERFETLTHRPGIVFSLHNRGLCHVYTGASHQAVADFSDVARLLEGTGDPHMLANARINLAGALKQLEFHREAWSLCESVLYIAQNSGDGRREALAWANMGDLSLLRNDPEQAIACARQALVCLDRFHDPWTKPAVLSTLGSAHAMQDKSNKAREYFQRCLQMRDFAPPNVMFDVHMGLADIEQDQDHPRRGIEHLERALETATEHGLRKERAQALHEFGRRYLALGVKEEARARLEEAASLYELLPAPSEAAIVRAVLDTLPRR
ncbi:tetratricopeptide repeat protein [Nocardiopsis alba]|uniref:Tetratricopeptide repeat protein n=1 Tax=Nocardiopsis alba TaxID=53437 RepID=A0A7K2IYC4_9ACTN|nr:tetratricopeptide repeat protein [Nocardiopsis alba]